MRALQLLLHCDLIGASGTMTLPTGECCEAEGSREGDGKLKVGNYQPCY